MDVKIQLLCILISFLYGIFINISFLFNKRINNKILNLTKDLLHVYIIVIIYTIIIYKINKGIFHIYFLIFILLGYNLSKKYVKLTNNLLKSIKKKNFKWYTKDNRVVIWKRKG